MPNTSSLFFYTNLPFVLSTQAYRTPKISQTTTIKAIASAPFFNDSAVASADYEIDPTTAPIPRSGLIQWQRSTSGITLSGSDVANWQDISGSLKDASNSSNRPTLASNAVNGMPAVNFNGSQFLQTPSGYSNFTSGLTAMLVAKPVSVSAGARLFEYGNGAASDNIIMSLPSNTGLTFSTYNSSTSSSATASSGATLGNFQLLESVYNGSNTATLFVNGGQVAQSTSMQVLNNQTRNNNFIAQDSSASNRFNGQLAEMLIWNRALTSAERTAVEGYLLNRYQTSSSNSVAAPVFSIASTTFSEPTQVAIRGPVEAEIFFTRDGSSPSTSSSLYSSPLMVTHTETIKAIAVVNGLQSNITTETFTLNSTKWPAPSAGDMRPLDLKQQLPAVGIPHDSNQP